MSKSALDNFKQDFQNKLNSELGNLHEIDFPEIGMKCYSREVITGFRKGKILAALKQNQVLFCAEMLINCLVDSDKNFIFNSGDAHDLMRKCDSKVLERVSGEISNVVFGDDDIEEKLSESSEEEIAAKNLKTTKS